MPAFLRYHRFRLALSLLAGLTALAIAAAVLYPPVRVTIPAPRRPAPHRIARVKPIPPVMVPAVRPSLPVAVPGGAAIYRAEHAMSFGQLMHRWNPLIAQASKRFGVPQTWIRAVMQLESGGRTMLDADLPMTSDAGAMGLMQLMPSTYGDMREAYRLGPDPYDPHDNVMAGAAYLRFLRGKYGYPQMFAAYNDGPGNLEARLVDGKLLPAETRLYMVNINNVLEGRHTGDVRGAMAELTRPDGTPIEVDCSVVVSVRASFPDEYAASVRTVIQIGRLRQGVREGVDEAKSIIRAHGGAV